MPTKHHSRLVYTLCIFVIISGAYGAHMHGGVFTGNSGSSTSKLSRSRVTPSRRPHQAAWLITVSFLFRFCQLLRAVTYSNGTEGAVPYRVPASLHYAATPGTPGADISAVSKCCLPFHADVAWYDSTRYTLHSSTDCNAAYRVCSLPSRVQAVWVCGCPGGDCSGAVAANIFFTT